MNKYTARLYDHKSRNIVNVSKLASQLTRNNDSGTCHELKDHYASIKHDTSKYHIVLDLWPEMLLFKSLTVFLLVKISYTNTIRKKYKKNHTVTRDIIPLPLTIYPPIISQIKILLLILLIIHVRLIPILLFVTPRMCPIRSYRI